MATNTTKQKSTAETSETATKLIPKDIDTSQLIPVYNGFQGRLIYKSVRTHETFVWDTFGDMQKTFFQNNWFMFDDDYAWVIDYLGVKTNYKHAISLEKFDDLFTKSPTEIEKVVSKLSPGQKKSVAYRARQLILTEEIDSRKTINALEKSLGETLIER